MTSTSLKRGWTMSTERSRGEPMRPRRSTLRTLVALALGFMVASLLILFVWGAVGRGFAGDRLRRAEIETREAGLYRQLADKDAILESQRRIYMERFRRLEAQIREKDQEIVALRVRLAIIPSGAIDRAVGVDQGPIGRPNNVDYIQDR